MNYYVAVSRKKKKPYHIIGVGAYHPAVVGEVGNIGGFKILLKNNQVQSQSETNLCPLWYEHEDFFGVTEDNSDTLLT